MNKEQVQQWKKRISEIKKEIGKIKSMRPGSISEQFNVCGNPNCHCKDKDNPQKHGPYYQLSYTFKGRSTTEFIKPEKLEKVQSQIQAHKKFKALSAEWIELSVYIAKEEKKSDRKVKRST